MRWRTRAVALLAALVIGVPVLLAALHLTLASALIVFAVAVAVTVGGWWIDALLARRRSRARPAGRSTRMRPPGASAGAVRPRRAGRS